MPKKIMIIALIALMAQICPAQNDPNDQPQFEFPYKARINGQGVYVRSGPAIQYYFTTQLNQPQVVTVVGNVYSWYKIVPPQGSFSWITKEEVMIDTETPGFGIVTGDNVRVWAGKPGLAPEDSTSLQVKLNKGDKVKLLGEESGDYYKIAPPEGAFLWIKGDYLDPMASAKAKPALGQAKPDTNAPADANTPAEPNKPAQTEPNQVSVVTREPEKPAKSDYEVQKTKQVYDLIKEIEQERQKPLNQQSYDQYKEQLTQIAEDEKAGTAAKYAKYQLERIKGYELAMQAEKELNLSDAELEKLRKKIDQWRQAQIKKLKQESDDYLATGILKKSLVFSDSSGSQRYMIVGQDGKIKCYAVAVGDAAYKDISNLLGKNVGLRGEVEPDPASGISLIKFDEIEVVKK